MVPKMSGYLLDVFKLGGTGVVPMDKTLPGHRDSGETYSADEREAMFRDVLTKYNPDKVDIFTQGIADSKLPGGDAANLREELTRAGIDLTNKAQAHEPNLTWLTDSLAKYGVKSFADLRADTLQTTKKGATQDIFWDARQGKIIPKDLATSFQGPGKTIYQLQRAENGEVGVRASWGGSSDWDVVRGVAMVVGVMSGAAALDVAISGTVGGGMASAGAVGAPVSDAVITYTAGNSAANALGNSVALSGGGTFAGIQGAGQVASGVTTAKSLIDTGTDAIKTAGKVLTLAGTAVGLQSTMNKFQPVPGFDAPSFNSAENANGSNTNANTGTDTASADKLSANAGISSMSVVIMAGALALGVYLMRTKG